MKAAEALLERMKPVREKMNDPTWQELVQRCYSENIDLQSTYMYVTLFIYLFSNEILHLWANLKTWELDNSSLA